MFEIEYKGGNATVIATKKAKVMIDPRLSVLGLKDLNVKDAVVLATEREMMVKSEDMVVAVDGPGEYEVSDISVRAIAADKHGAAKGSKELTIYRIEIGDVRIAVLGNIAPELSEDQLEAFGVVDMVILPVGGGNTLNATEAAQLARTIDAKAIIPVHYDDSALQYAEPQDGVETFEKELGSTVEQVAKYKIKSAAALPSVSTIIEIARS